MQRQTSLEECLLLVYCQIDYFHAYDSLLDKTYDVKQGVIQGNPVPSFLQIHTSSSWLVRPGLLFL